MNNSEEYEKRITKLIKIVDEVNYYNEYIHKIAKILKNYGIKTKRDKIVVIDDYDDFDIVNDTFIFITKVYREGEHHILHFDKYEVLLYGCNKQVAKDVKHKININ